MYLQGGTNISVSVSATFLSLLYLMEATGNKAWFLSRGPQYIGFRYIALWLLIRDQRD